MKKARFWISLLFCFLSVLKIWAAEDFSSPSGEIPSSPDDRFYALSNMRLKDEIIIAVKIGLGVSDFIIHPASATEISRKVDFSFSAGLRFGYFPSLFGFFFDIEWHKKGALTNSGAIHVNTIDIIWQGGIRKGIFYFTLGSYIGFITVVKSINNGIESDVSDFFNKLDIGFIASAGMLITKHMKFYIGFEFKLGFTDIVDAALFTSEKRYSHISMMIVLGFGI